MGALADGASRTLHVTARADAGTGGTTITNTASVTHSDQPDPVPGNDTASADVTPQSADLSVDKIVDSLDRNHGAFSALLNGVIESAPPLRFADAALPVS